MLGVVAGPLGTAVAPGIPRENREPFRGDRLHHVSPAPGMFVPAVEQHQDLSGWRGRTPGGIKQPRTVAAGKPMLRRNESSDDVRARIFFWIGTRWICRGTRDPDRRILQVDRATAEKCCSHAWRIRGALLRSPDGAVKYAEL